MGTKVGRLHHPFHVLLLLFLQTLCSEGGDGYHKPCNHYKDCETKYCDQIRKVCECPETMSVTGVPLTQVYHEPTKKCYSPVGSICFIKNNENKHFHPFSCVPNAVCHKYNVRKLPQNKGICECASGYYRDSQHLCEKVEEDVWSTGFAGRLGLPEDSEGNNNGVEVKVDSAKKPTASKLNEDKTNGNQGFHIDQDKQEKLDLGGMMGGASSLRALLSMYLATATLLTFVFLNLHSFTL